jgi:hypothetical protein
MPGLACDDYKQLPDKRKRWRYPGVPIPARLKHRYKADTGEK